MRWVLIVSLVGGVAVAGVAVAKQLGEDGPQAEATLASVTYTITSEDGDKTVCAEDADYQLCSSLTNIEDEAGRRCDRPPFPACDSRRRNGDSLVEIRVR